jgi:H+-transporting ATPase
VYPEHKFLIVEALRQAGFACGMTGDGVNDAPALKRADIGIAVEGSTDAARAAADIVLTQPGLGVVVEAIVIARMIFQRIKNFINYRIAATLQLLTFFFIAVFVFDPSVYWGHHASSRVETKWPEFFSLPVLMLMLITLVRVGTCPCRHKLALSWLRVPFHSLCGVASSSVHNTSFSAPQHVSGCGTAASSVTAVNRAVPRC